MNKRMIEKLNKLMERHPDYEVEFLYSNLNTSATYTVGKVTNVFVSRVGYDVENAYIEALGIEIPDYAKVTSKIFVQIDRKEV